MTRLASRILMVRPEGFRRNEETAVDNAFMPQTAGKGGAEKEALREYDDLVGELEGGGVEVVQFTPEKGADLPDAVFPNNWFTTHFQLGGAFVLYPMRAESRRRERQPSIIQFLRKKYPICVDLSEYEHRGEFLEGTGSLILDRTNRIAFVARSRRSSETLAERWSELMGYRLLSFDTRDDEGVPIYHTNVLMCIGDGFSIVCPEVLTSHSRQIVLKTLEEGSREIIEISKEQLENFCGNVLQLQGNGSKLIVMSSRAFQSFTSQQRAQLSIYGKILHTDISTIENCGGGGVRCMLAELF